MKDNFTIASSRSRKVRQLLVKSKTQRLIVCFEDETTKYYPVSTALAGIGNTSGSYQTPYGWHIICDKIGAGEPAMMIFRGRVATGELAVINHSRQSTSEDIITSRILWLQGLEREINLEGAVDSRQRYIYIHGTNEEGLIGSPVSKGCIRMTNSDIIELYDMVDTDTTVFID